jgi:hypothetical protein
MSLRYEIITSIMTSLGIINRANVKKSILDDDFIIPKSIQFIIGDIEYSSKIRGVNIVLPNSSNLNILHSYSNYDNITEHFLMVQIDGLYTYGCYLSSEDKSHSNISYHTNDNWIDCNKIQDLRFALGLEQSIDLSFGWSPMSDHDAQCKLLISFAESISIGKDEDEG